MKDYSQWGEQKYILEYFAGKTNGKFLEIGAWDGVEGSNVRALADIGWSGVCIEASPFIFQDLIHNYSHTDKVTCVNAALMECAGLAKFRDTLESSRRAYGQMSSCFDNKNLTDLVVRNYFVGAIDEYDIAKTFGEDWDFVSLDIEGMDLNVLKSIGRLLKKTQLICIEDAIPWTPFEQPYYNSMLAAAATHGFTKVIGRTQTNRNEPANTILARA